MDLNFTPKGWDEYLAWQSEDRKTLKKINQILSDIARNPFEGIAKQNLLLGICPVTGVEGLMLKTG